MALSAFCFFLSGPSLAVCASPYLPPSGPSVSLTHISPPSFVGLKVIISPELKSPLKNLTVMALMSRMI